MVLDGMPHGTVYKTSVTERAAEQYEERLMQTAKKSLASARYHLEETNYYLRVFDAMMSTLQEQDRQVITMRYIDHQSLDHILEMLSKDYPVHSKTALHKRCRRLMADMDHVLYAIGAVHSKL